MIRDLVSMLHRGSTRRFVTSLLVLGAALRIVAILLFGDLSSPYLYEHGIVARNILAGHGYAMHFPPTDFGYPELSLAHLPPPPTAFTLPSLVALDVVVLSLFGEGDPSTAAFFAMNVIAATLSLSLLFVFVRALLDERIARVALAAASVYPPFVYAAATFGGTVYYHAAMLLALCAFLWLRREGTARAAFIAGITCGAWMYFRSEALVALLVLAVSLWRSLPRDRIALYVASALITVAPWMVRNAITFDVFVPMTTNGWLNAWRGNDPASTGGAFTSEGKSRWFDDDIRARIAAIPPSPHREIEIMNVYRSRTIDFVRSHPFDALRLFGKKLLLFWTTDVSDPRAHNAVYLASTALLLLTFIAGFLSLAREGRLPFVLVWIVGIFSVLVAALHVEIRYQITVSMLLIPFAASSLTHRAALPAQKCTET